MRPISQIPAVKLCLLGLAALATLTLAGCASSNLSQTYDDTTGSTASRTRAETEPAAPAPRQATARRKVSQPTDVSAIVPVRDDGSRRSARRSDVASDAAPAPKPLSDEWLKIEDEKEDKLRRSMNICRGC